MSYTIGTHDYDVRVRAAERFLLQDNKVYVCVGVYLYIDR